MNNEVLKHLLQDIHKDIKNLKDVDIKNLTDLAVKTNGRLSNLEAWRNRMVGAITIIGIILIPIVGQLMAKVVMAYF